MKIDLPDGTAALILERSDALAWVLMPAFIERVRGMCSVYDSEADQDIVADAISRAFTSQTPGLIGLLHLDELGKPIGHMLVSAGEWMGTQIVSVLQLELERTPSRPLTEIIMGWLERWGAANGAKFIHCTTRSAALARLFQSQYGFEKGMVLMRRGIRQERVAVQVAEPNQVTKEVSQ